MFNILLGYMNNCTIKTIENVTVSCSRETKIEALKRCINMDKYNLIGIVDRTCSAVLQPKFYNVRDRFGRFVRIRSKR